MTTISAQEFLSGGQPKLVKATASVPATPPAAPKGKSFLSGVKFGASSRAEPQTDNSVSAAYAGAEKIKSSFNTIKSGAQDKDLSSGARDIARGALGLAAGGIETAFSPLTGFVKDVADTPVVNPAVQAVKNYVIDPASDKISDSKALQEFMVNDPNADAVVGDLITVFSTVFGGSKSGDIASTVEKPIANTIDRTTAIAKNITSKVTPIKNVQKFSQNLGEKISSPNVTSVERVSLNPVEALKGTNQDIKISVGGKLKKLSELNIDEQSKLKVSTQKSMSAFSKQAEKFLNDRGAEGGSPVEIVGKRTDSALTFADKKRQAVGQKMGEIENKFSDEAIPFKEETYKNFIDIVDSAKKPSYGTNLMESPVVKKLVEDFDELSKAGLTVAERNKFVRAWDAVLRDAKDPFGNFKENGSIYYKIQNAVNSVKKETVDVLASKNKTYRNLRKQYADYIKLNEIGDSLLGKSGALGERIKGAATVKRAIQSNSDAGARQFLLKLKELTGYDAIREGDLAIIAMKNIGDYQGLSLLDILNDGKSGIIKRGLQYAQDKIVGNNTERIRKFIQK